MQPNEIISFDNPEFGQVRAVSGKVGPKRYPLRNRKFFGWNMEKFARISFAYCT